MPEEEVWKRWDRSDMFSLVLGEEELEGDSRVELPCLCLTNSIWFPPELSFSH